MGGPPRAAAPLAYRSYGGGGMHARCSIARRGGGIASPSSNRSMLLPASVEVSRVLPLLLPLLLSPSEAWKYPAQPGGMYQPFVYQDITAVPSPSHAAAHSDDGGIFFSGFFTDHAVLQRGTKAKAAVYGAVTGAAKSITVVVAEEGADSYHVAAQIASQGVGNLTWKALLKPHPAYGGNVTITARCDGCTGNTSTTISGLTYGDVWFCSGQR
jgi:hypothetical protein